MVYNQLLIRHLIMEARLIKNAIKGGWQLGVADNVQTGF